MQDTTNKATALAMCCEKPRAPFVPKVVDLPWPTTGEVLVKNLFTTICTSDLHTCMGRRSSPLPGVLGHEIIGEVVALPTTPILDYHGQELQLGDRLTWTVYAHNPSDELAQRGIPQKAAGLFKYGHVEAVDTATTLSGGFASHCLLQPGTTLFKLPAELSAAEAAPLNCTHATMAGALRLAGSVKGKKVLVSGAGMLGLSACTMAKEGGASAVWAIDPIAARREQALLFGASQAWSPQEYAGQPKADVLIETSGIPEAMEQGLLQLAIGGIAVWTGAVFAQRDLAINAEVVVRNILTIKGLHNYTPQDLAAAIHHLSNCRTRYPFDRLVGACYPLTALDQAIQEANQGNSYRIGIFPNQS